MGSSNTTLAAFQFTETSNIEDIKISDLNIFQQVASTTTQNVAGIANLKLYKSSDLTNPIATAGAANTSVATSTPGAGYYYTFRFGSPVIVPKSNSVTLILKGDIASYTPSGAADNATHIFKIATSTDTANDTNNETVNALGSTSNNSSSISFATGSTAPTGNALTMLRTKLSAAVAQVKTDSAKKAADDIGTITFTADSAGTAAVNSVIITFGGTLPSGTVFLANADLLDQNGNSVMNTTGVTSSTAGTCSGGNTCTKTWNLGGGTAGWQVSGGSSYTFKVRANSVTGTFGGQTGVSPTLTVALNANTDVRYTDGLDSSASTLISLPANVVPLTIGSVTYAQGS
jgi:hypothetical protein